MSKGVLYCMTTVVPGLIKIGKTTVDSFDNRMYSLERNGYSNVVGLKRHFAIEVEDYDAKEILLDEIFSKSRVPNTELFALDIDLVVQLLSSFDGKQIYPKTETKEEVFQKATEERNVKAEISKPDFERTKQLRYNFWVDFENYAFKNKEFKENFKYRKPSYENWLNYPIGSSICHLALLQIRKYKKIGIEIYIGNNKQFFRKLFNDKCFIENETGLLFDWRELPNCKSSSIRITKDIIFEDSMNQKEQFDWIIDVMLKMKRVIVKYVKRD